MAAFKDVFVINNAQSSWVQMAFYGGYGTMAIPAALFIRRFSYKSGILLGLGLYALGALLCVPAASMASFNLFLVALYSRPSVSPSWRPPPTPTSFPWATRAPQRAA